MLKLGSVYKNLVFLASIAGNYLVFVPLFRLMKRRYPSYANSAANICIEGFPRCGNTFFVAAVQRWNPGLIVSHHSHLASSVSYSRRIGIPTVVLIREPAAAVSSAMVWDGKIVATIGLLVYISFYRGIRRAFPHVLILEFEEYTKNPDLAVERINIELGTNLKWVAFDASEREAIQRYLTNHDSRNERVASSSSLPNKEKAAQKQTYIARVRGNGLFGAARGLYESLTSSAS